MVEHHVANVKVAGSNLVSRSAYYQGVSEEGAPFLFVLIGGCKGGKSAKIGSTFYIM